jgi:ubiquinone/menaquinone biosynthesis C-methylase UbiE
MHVENLEAWLPLLRSPGGGRSLHHQGQDLVDDAGGRYPVEDGIPRLLDPEALRGGQARWKRFFDWFAPLYDRSERVGVRVVCGLDLRAEQRRIVESLPIVPGSSLLEVCTGPGVYQPLLAKAVGTQGRLAALDLSWGMVRICAQRTRGQRPVPLVVQGNGAALPFADASFDHVFHFGGIKLFSSPEQALAECARVLRPGGLLFLGDEGFIPTVPARGWRRRLLLRVNPCFRRPPPRVPPQLTLKRQENVYDGLAFLWTIERGAA